MTSLNSIRRVTADKPPRVVLYGPPGTGKTTLAAEFPAPIFIQTEDGESAGLEFDAFPKATSWAEVWEHLCALANPGHDFRTVVIDSLASLEPLIWAEACALNGWESIEAPGYGKGYVEADTLWRKLISGLDYLRADLRMNVVLIGHSCIANYPNPAGVDFARWDVSLHKRAREIIERAVDCILMIDYDTSVKEVKDAKGVKSTKSTGSQMRYIWCNGSPARNAKNRYNLPNSILYQRGTAYATLAKYFPGSHPSETVNETSEDNG